MFRQYYHTSPLAWQVISSDIMKFHEFHNHITSLGGEYHHTSPISRKFVVAEFFKNVQENGLFVLSPNAEDYENEDVGINEHLYTIQGKKVTVHHVVDYSTEMLGDVAFKYTISVNGVIRQYHTLYDLCENNFEIELTDNGGWRLLSLPSAVAK